MQYFLYILKSTKDKKLYVGISQNIKRRLTQHNAGLVRSTKFRKPFELLYTESFPSRTDAREREKYFKSYQGSKEKMTILENL